MRFEILGPVRLCGAEHTVTITAGRERTLLAVLLLNANQTVPFDELAEAIWHAHAPRSARDQLQGCIYRLRTRIANLGVDRQLIVTDSAGYRAVVDPDELDLLQFRRLVTEARAAASAGELARAGDAYLAALRLWGGAALADVDSPRVRQAAAALDEEHIQVLEARLEVELELGGAGELIAELTDLVGKHPYRERLHRALMLALYRAGRQTDALAAYRRARGLLADQLGIEPGEELQRLHHAILNRDPSLDVPRAPAGTPRPERGVPSVPRELPADVAGFTGRGHELGMLDDLSPDGEVATRPVVISAIAGTAGVGKTALAVHWAHRVTDRFPDGQLYVNLRGYDPDRPVAPADALARFLTALGVAGQDIPLELDDRATRYRSEVADRRLLIVLDNAATVEQVRPLLPGSSSCTVVVTSRGSLAGLVAVDGARRLVLDVLLPADAIMLLRRLIGPRVDAEPDAAATLADQCARLPLALRVAAELAVSRPTILLADLVAELEDQERRLDLLDGGGDPYAAVRVVFSWSIRHLPADAVRTFRLLGLHPGPDFDAYAAAALTEASLEQARHALDVLARVHLVHPTAPDRYGMHDLLRAYATHLADADDTLEQRRAALERLFNYYLASAATAMDSWYPAGDHRRRPTPVTPLPALPDPDVARAWLDTERACLVAAAAHTATLGWPSLTSQLSSTLFRYLDSGHYTDALAVHGHACDAAELSGDLSEQAHALRYLGTTYVRMGRYQLAAHQLQQALARCRRVGDKPGEAMVLANLAFTEQRRGRHASAVRRHERALALFRQVGDEAGEALTLTNLAVVYARMCRGPAADHVQRALHLSQKLGNPRGEAYALLTLGNVDERQGRYASAGDYHQRALARFEELGHRAGEARALDSLGIVHLRLGQLGRAMDRFQQALTLFQEIGDRDGEACALNGLGEVAYLAGRHADAVTQHADAIAIATNTHTSDEMARAHAGLGRAHQALGDHDRARTHYEDAIALYTDLEMPEAEEVRTHLADLTRAPTPATTSRIHDG